PTAATTGRPPGSPAYIHLDIDACDPADLPAVACPTPGGPTAPALAATLRALHDHHDVVGIGICEYAPVIEHTPQRVQAPLAALPVPAPPPAAAPPPRGDAHRGRRGPPAPGGRARAARRRGSPQPQPPGAHPPVPPRRHMVGRRTLQPAPPRRPPRIHLRHAQHEPEHVRIPRSTPLHQPEQPLERQDVRPLRQILRQLRIQQPRRTRRHRVVHPQPPGEERPRPPQRLRHLTRVQPTARGDVHPQHRRPLRQLPHPGEPPPLPLRQPPHRPRLTQHVRLELQPPQLIEARPEQQRHPRRRLQPHPPEHPPVHRRLPPHIAQRRRHHPRGNPPPPLVLLERRHRHREREQRGAPRPVIGHTRQRRP